MSIYPYLLLFYLAIITISIIALAISAATYRMMRCSKRPKKRPEVKTTMKFHELLYLIALVLLIMAVFATSIHAALFLAMLILSGLTGGIGWLMKDAE